MAGNILPSLSTVALSFTLSEMHLLTLLRFEMGGFNVISLQQLRCLPSSSILLQQRTIYLPQSFHQNCVYFRNSQIFLYDKCFVEKRKQPLVTVRKRHASLFLKVKS